MDRSVSCRAQQQEKEVQEEAAAAARKSSSEGDDVLQGWPKVGLSLFALGFLVGPLLDAIHSRVQLQVFPMLRMFYSVVGVLQLVLDKYLARKDNMPTADLPKVLFSIITLATLLEVSAELYKVDTPFNIVAYTLFAL